MRKHVFKGRVIDVGTEDVRLPSGVSVTLDVIRHPGAALVVPLQGEHVLLIRQWRHAAGGWLWECPAGTLNPGETPEACALREVVEEAGVSAGRLDHAGFIYTAPGFCDEKIHIFVARDLRAVPSQHDEDEVIAEVKAVRWSECMEMLARNEIQDAKTLAGLLHARRFLP